MDNAHFRESEHELLMVDYIRKGAAATRLPIACAPVIHYVIKQSAAFVLEQSPKNTNAKSTITRLENVFNAALEITSKYLQQSLGCYEVAYSD